MRQSWKKIVVAILLASGNFAFTHIVYLRTAPLSRNRSHQQPIAFVSTVSDEVLRRPVTRTIWQMLEAGEPVYPGEAVKTSSKGEVSLEFVGTKKRLDVEPDSMVVLTRHGSEIAMDLLDGGVFVGQASGSQEA
ncbi:MAG: hypothetical protein C5B49_04930, partial [Bdellovibrio sp.]